MMMSIDSTDSAAPQSPCLQYPYSHFQELEEERKALEEAKKRPDGILGYLYNKHHYDQDGSMEFSCANLFRIMCCTYPKQINEREQLKRIADSLDALNRRMEMAEG